MKRFVVALPIKHVSLLLLLTLFGCAVDRPIKPVVANAHRIAKKLLEGNHVFLKSATELRYPGAKWGWMPPGFYLEHSVIVDFQIKETLLEITARHALPDRNPELAKNRILASFPIRHVDVLRKQNADGEDTNEEEETETRRPWKDRSFLIVDWDRDRLDRFHAATLSATIARPLEIDTDTGSMQFSVQRHLDDGSLVTERYSFLKAQERANYERRPYPLDEQRRFGFFHASSYEPDAYGRFTQSRQKDWINRWDITQPIVFFLSPGFPSHLKNTVERAIAKWNDAFFAATGKRPIQVRENTGQQAGDLRYNLIHYDETETGRHGILGYGPTVTDPLTGRILKGDVFLYAAPFRRALYHERVLAQRDEPAMVTEERLIRAALPAAKLGFLEQSLRKFSKPEPLVETLAEQYPDVHKMRDSLNDARFGEQGRYLTPFTPALGGAITRGTLKWSDAELETRVFQPLLSHEMGHTLGLRHNFFASADEKHFAADAHASSVMDYGFLITQEPIAAGPYDFAAIRYAYGSTGDSRDALAGNYFYCTDEDQNDSAQALCQPFDSGATLVQFVRDQFRRYADSYRLNNLREDRVHFPLDSYTYIDRVLALLLPLRTAFDNATAILKVASRPAAPARLADYWNVLGARIEADSSSKRISELMISEPTERGAPARVVRRLIDLAKIPTAVEDARLAQTTSIRALLDVVRLQRPNFATVLLRQIQARGVLADKLVALLLLVQPSDDPLGGGDRIAPYSSYRPGNQRYLAKQLAYLIAGLGDPDRERPADPNLAPPMMPPAAPFAQIAPMPRVAEDTEDAEPADINLRRFALGLIAKYLVVPSATAPAHDQLFVERIAFNSELLDQVEALRERAVVHEKLRPHLLKSKSALLNRITDRIWPHFIAPTFPDPSLLLTLNALPQMQELKRLDDLIEQGEEAIKQLPVKEALVQGEEAVAASAWRARSRHRRIHKEIFRQQLLNDELGAIQLDALALQAKQNLEDLATQNLVYTSVLPTGKMHFRAYVQMKDSGNLPTVSGYLIRDTINQLEDDRTVYRELATELRDLSLTTDVARVHIPEMQMALDPAEIRKATQRETERRLRIAQLATRLESLLEPLGDRIAAEKQLLWEIEDVYLRRRR